jgi:hypothetical protein
MNPLTARGRLLAIAVCACLGLSTTAFAQHGGGGHGGGGHAGGFGGHAGGYGGHGGAYGGRGYGGGWRGGYGGYGGWRGGWGWGWGLGYGAFLAALPFYYSTWWWDGVPYYYAYNNYYVWSPSSNGYVVTTPPAQVVSQAGGSQGTAPTAGATTVFAYPKNGQSAELQSSDKYACHQWAVTQTGFDPTAATPGTATVTVNAQAQRQDYMRAQAACLEGRGYSVQ